MELILRQICLILTLLFYVSCSSAPGISSNPTSPGPSALSPQAKELSSPKRKEPTGDLETIAILGTNDIHGVLAPLTLKTVEDSGIPSVSYEAGGIPMIAAYIHVLRAEFGDRFLWVDAGDSLQGTLESRLDGGSSLIQFFNQYHLISSAVGNHEFDFGLETLNQRIREAQFPFLASNISTRPNAPPSAAEFISKIKPHQILTVGNLRVGILGLSTPETPLVGAPSQVSNTLQFESLKSATLREALELRKQGAQIVLLVAHAGLQCTPNPGSVTSKLRKSTEIQGGCSEQSEIVRLLRAIPAKTIDAVISGHTHTLVHHWISGIPVIQGGAFGRYLNVIYLTYDWSQKSVLSDETRIEGPIPVCSQIFQNQKDCNGDRPPPRTGRGPLVAPRFHGKTLSPAPEVLAWLNPLLEKTKTEGNHVFGRALRPIEHRTDSESELGNLVADAMRQATGADFALINPGGIRNSLDRGSLTLDSVFRAIPFESKIALIRLTPNELERLFRTTHDGKRGLGSVSGLQLRLIDPKIEASNRFLQIIYPPSFKKQLFTLATTDFLAMGGDGLQEVLAGIPEGRIQLDTGKLVRDAVLDYLVKTPKLNSIDHPLIDPKRPRLIFDKPPSKNVVNLSHGKGKKRRNGAGTRNPLKHRSQPED